MITGENIVEDARRYLGAPYQLGGRSREALDCVGLAFQMIPRDFGYAWECETPTPDQNSGIAWERVEATLQGFGFQQIPVTDAQLGDLVVMKIPLGGGGTVKVISALDGLVSFFGVSRFIHFLQPTFLEESGPTYYDMVSIRRELKMDMQTYVKRLWRFYRYPFVECESLDATRLTCKNRRPTGPKVAAL